MEPERERGAVSRASLMGLVLAYTLACAPLKPPPSPPLPTGPPPPASPYPELDAHVAATPPEVEKTAASLAAYLIEPARSDREKAWVIFRWVADNVTYDVQGFRSGEYGDLSADQVLHSRSAVCDGYSNLFDALAASAGLESVHVSGYAKGTGYLPGEPFTGPNHAWNAVRIEGRWQLVDCTWGAGNLDEEGKYERVFEPYYFMPPPEEFLFTHFPLEQRWQLVDSPITLEQFIERPLLKTAFFTCGLRLLSHRYAIVTETGPLMTVEMTAPESSSLIAELRRGDDKVKPERVDLARAGEHVTVRVLFPEKGRYTLRLFATRGPSWGVHQWALDLGVEALSGVPAATLESYTKSKEASP